ncbi:protein KASH5 isoform X5 [Hylobates moloch]|uniref:protein KASH5 isoform X5 n=1 Tax=Hylobates moloch TaxID=81572 RepID=UPI0026747CDA|nr:protein KASH5 isoform X5 [Hylobates moloch]
MALPSPYRNPSEAPPFCGRDSPASGPRADHEGVPDPGRASLQRPVFPERSRSSQWQRAHVAWGEQALGELGVLGAAGPFPVPPREGGRLVALPAAASWQGWPMDLPEGPVGGPTAETEGVQPPGSGWQGPRQLREAPEAKERDNANPIFQRKKPRPKRMYLWEQPEEARLGMPISLEEQILNSTFEACDPQRTGTVAVAQVLAYLEAVTGKGPQDARLQTLANSLDPNAEGPKATVDLDTFLVVMRDWIAACQLHGGLELEEETAFEGALTSRQLPSGYQGGQHPLVCLPGCPEAEETANLESFGGEDPGRELQATADLLSNLEDLELSNRRLAGENAKLQRSVETAEEGSARLEEEILALRKQLHSTQQALQFAKAVDEELEDLKTLARSLEEQNRSLLAQARQAEKEQQHLVAEMETLQLENGKLLAERDGVKKRSQELAMEKDTLKRQLFECEHLICQRDTILSERTRRVESLAQTLEEYRVTTQELRLEISRLEEQLSQTYEGPDELPEGAQLRRVGWTQLLPPSLGLEIEAIRQKQEVATADLSNPLCGVWQWEEVIHETNEEAEFPSEAPAGGQRNFQGEPAHPEEGRKEPSMWLTRREEEDAESQVTADLAIPLGDPRPGDIPESLPESRPVQRELQQALVPVMKELVPVRRRAWGQLCLPPQRLRVTRHPLIPAPVLGLLLLLLLLSVLLLGPSPPPTWPHLQLCYLQPPPV